MIEGNATSQYGPGQYAPGKHGPARYGPVLSGWIAVASPPPLDEGEPRGGMPHSVEGPSVKGPRVDAKSQLDTAAAFAHTRVSDAGMADCCVAGVWLLYNELERAHRLCQDVPTTSGSYWHGIVHRRESDFGNAQYWFGRSAGHPAIGPIAAEVGASAEAASAFPGGWTPEAMVDGCRRAMREAPTLAAACLAAQQIEWRGLFDHCYRAATA